MSLTGYRENSGIIQDVTPQKPLPTLAIAGVDSGGNALPFDFDSLESTFTRNVTGSIATEARTDGVSTWTQTYTRDGSDNITTVSKWVKS